MARTRAKSKAAPPQLAGRHAGILLHPTSLPGPHGIGDLGPAARRFVDFLVHGGQRWWQMLPTHPVGEGYSPYSALSAFAGAPLLISLEDLVAQGWLKRSAVRPVRGLRADRVSYGAVERFKVARLRQAYAAFVGDGGLASGDFLEFCTAQRHWLDDHALYSALRRRHGARSWTRWPRPLRTHQARACAAAAHELEEDVDYERFVQYVFDRQWRALRRYAAKVGVGLIGDIPIFVGHDSSDVWAHQPLFNLDRDGRPKTVSGVPPDYFSRTGQKWGHPHYRWARHEESGFGWWITRFARVLEHFDAVRIDHFLGFNRVWAVPGRARTAKNGRWVKTPGRGLFRALQQQLGTLPIIAEDLGVVVPEAVQLREDFGFPGMRLLHFAFGNDEGDRFNQPHRLPENCVVYPGTHDNETTVGWFTNLRKAHRKQRKGGELTPYERVLRYTGTTGREIHWDLIRLAYISSARLAVVPLQDVLGLDNAARMNVPGTAHGNWTWRCPARQLTAAAARKLRDLADAYERR